MAKQQYTASEAAAALGISLDTLRRWDRDKRIKVTRDSSNKRVVAAKEIDRLRGDGQHITARNRFRRTLTHGQGDRLPAQVEIVVTEPTRIVALVTRDAVEELGLKKGMAATAIVKST